MMQDKTTLGISDTFREYIEALVEEVVINGAPFEAQKKWLRKNSEAECLDYETLEKNLNDLFEAIKELEGNESKFVERSVKALAKECYLSEALVNKFIGNAATIRTQKEVAERRKREDRERKAREEAERKAREEQDRIAKEKAQWQKKLEAERKAKEEAEHLALAAEQARKEAEWKAREEKERIAREKEDRKAREEAEHQEKMKKAEALFQQWVNYYPKGTEVDNEKAEKRIHLLKESAVLGNPKAQYCLSQAFRFGLGIKQDFKEAFRLAMASALQDNPRGQLSVGVEYLYGGEVEPNDELAFSWISKSAQAGNPDGMVYLAICYQHGIGVARNLGYANKLISQAKEIDPKGASYFSRLINCATEEYIRNVRKSYYENHK